MKALITAPFIPISDKLYSHRSAQGVIYADQIKQAGVDVTCNTWGKHYNEDHNTFDEMYVYHGSDWSGNINLFGGMNGFPYIDNFVNFSRFKGKIYSLVVDFPDYAGLMKYKIDQLQAKNKPVDQRWLDIDWNNVDRMRKTATTVNPNTLCSYPKIAIGDSHAICMYRPGWMVNSVPFKTLHGACSSGFETFLFDGIEFQEIELYFGNIDVRHHLCRMPDPEKATRNLVDKYCKKAGDLAKKHGASVRIYEPLPIEDESRSIPKTGWYKGQPFHGTWADRNEVRRVFIDQLEKNDVEVFKWTSGLVNSKGQLDFKYMERPHSVHLSREYYPHWQGREWSKIEEKTINKPVYHASLESFL
jgi:hypothetical protein